jgi:glycosyltransferase involved in cell wall biosynthesis
VHPVSHTFPRPHDVAPIVEGVRVVLAIKNFSSIPGVCHIGLGVTAANTQKVLRRAGIQTEVWSINKTSQASETKLLWQMLAKQENVPRPVTHVVISSPAWIQPGSLHNFALRWPNVTFVQLNHSGCAYLSIDKYGIRNIRDVAGLAEQFHNIKVAANNDRVAKFISALGTECLLLPNLYDPESFIYPATPQRLGNTVRIGSFGASRPWKNQLTAAEAAVMLAKALGCKLELYVNSKRPDGGERMIESRAELFHDLPGAKLVDVPWASWPRFRDITATMHLLMQPSFDETFNVCTADGIAEGVPSVTSSALEWTPPSWWAHSEDPSDIMRVGIGLLHAPAHAVAEGRTLLKKYTATGLIRWREWLLGQPAIPY